MNFYIWKKIAWSKLATYDWNPSYNFQEVVGLIQALHFTSEDELNFDLEEFLDFNKVPGLDDSSSEPETQTGDEPDLT